MSVFESYEDEIRQQFRQFDQTVAQLQHLSIEQKPAELDKLQKLLNNIDSSLESLNLESNRTGKSTAQYTTQYNQARKTFQQQRDKYQNDKSYNELMGGSTFGRNFDNSASMTQRERVNRGNKTLESGIQMIKMANDQVNQDKRVAEETLNNLAHQRERLQGFEGRFDSIDSLLGRARSTISTMSRREIANKLIMAGIVIVLLISIILIIWLKFVKGNNSNEPTPTPTPTSTPAPTDPPVTDTPVPSTSTTTTTTSGTTTV